MTSHTLHPARSKTARGRYVHRLLAEKVCPRHSNGRPRRPYAPPKPRVYRPRETYEIVVTRTGADGSYAFWPSIKCAVDAVGLTRRQIEYAIAIGRMGKQRTDGSLWKEANKEGLAAA